MLMMNDEFFLFFCFCIFLFFFFFFFSYIFISTHRDTIIYRLIILITTQQKKNEFFIYFDYVKLLFLIIYMYSLNSCKNIYRRTTILDYCYSASTTSFLYYYNLNTRYHAVYRCERWRRKRPTDHTDQSSISQSLLIIK